MSSSKSPRKYARFILSVALALLALAPMQAASAEATQHVIQSEVLGASRTISVQLPDSYGDTPEAQYPTLYLLDGESNLEFTAAVTQFLQQNNQIPQMILVAIHAGATRSQDYLPPRSGGNEQDSPADEVSTQPVEGPTGRADLFLSFIEKELIPFVEVRFRAAPLRVLSGHSYGGLFTTYAMANKPGLFAGYLTQSPYFDEGLGGPVLAMTRRALAATPAPAAFYYMNLGEEPELAPMFAEFEGALRQAPRSVRWKATQDLSKQHMTTRMVGQYEGLEQLFASNWPLPQAELMEGRAKALSQHQSELSKRYGYPVLLNEAIFQQATQMFLQLGDPTSAIQAGRLYAKQYPKTPIARLLLASALGSSGDFDAANQAISKGIELYQADPRQDWSPLLPAMKQLQQQIQAQLGNP